MFNKLCVMGLGYIGLPTSSLFASNGLKVIGIDISKYIVDTINNGNIHIEENGLEEIVNKTVKSGNLIASLEPQEADAFIIAVPTPFKHNDNPIREADMSYVEAAMRAILPYLKKGNLVILESTSPINTSENLLKPIIEEAGFIVGEDIYLAHCPERVLPGKILYEAVNNARVIGGINEKSALLAKELYEYFVKGEIYITTATTAEMCKLMENTYRDVNIALANELANICSKVNVNVWEVIKYANKHPRVNIHSPGPGVGGHCISVDPWFIVEKFPNDANIMKLSRNTNDNQPKRVVEFVEKIIENTNINKITIMGITYKADVDDTRESPSLEILNLIKEKFPNIIVSAYDPHVNNKKFELSSFEEAFKNSDLSILLTNHGEFNKISPNKVANLMNKKIIYDTRNFLNLEEWKEAGFITYLLGRD